MSKHTPLLLRRLRPTKPTCNNFKKVSPSHQCQRKFARPLSTTTPTALPDEPRSSSQPPPPSNPFSLRNAFGASPAFASPNAPLYRAPTAKVRVASLSYRPPPKPHHLHVFAHKHNCHITLTAGNRDALISVSSGNLNFRKHNRGSYDAAYQLGCFVMAKIKNMGMLDERYTGKGGPLRSLEVVLRDFGPGREAISKLLLSSEGALVRPKVTKVMDSTRIKFGGTRGKKPRRIG